MQGGLEHSTSLLGSILSRLHLIVLGSGLQPLFLSPCRLRTLCVWLLPLLWKDTERGRMWGKRIGFPYGNWPQKGWDLRRCSSSRASTSSPPYPPLLPFPALHFLPSLPSTSSPSRAPPPDAQCCPFIATHSPSLFYHCHL